jgi:hypothetical protein
MWELPLNTPLHHLRINEQTSPPSFPFFSLPFPRAYTMLGKTRSRALGNRLTRVKGESKETITAVDVTRVVVEECATRWSTHDGCGRGLRFFRRRFQSMIPMASEVRR